MYAWLSIYACLYVGLCHNEFVRVHDMIFTTSKPTSSDKQMNLWQ